MTPFLWRPKSALFIPIVALSAAIVFSPIPATVAGNHDFASDDGNPPLRAEDAEKAIAIPEMLEGDRNLTYPILYVGTKQIVGLGLLSALDKDVTMFDSFSVETFRDGWRRGPEWDDDQWSWNYIGHPLWGSETFLRARAQNFNFAESFAFSTAASVIWEFGMENWTANPSTQDLLFTSTAGSLIGEFRYHVLRKVAGKDDRKSKTIRFLFDPLQGTSKFVGKRFFGADLEEPAFRFQPTLSTEGEVGVTGSFSIRF